VVLKAGTVWLNPTKPETNE